MTFISAHSLSHARRFMQFAGALGLLCLGLYLRLDSIAASLWIDEFGTFWVVERDFMMMLRRCWEFQGQTPFYYLLPWLSIWVLGESEVSLRLPSLILNGLFASVLYACARSLAGPRAGYVAAALGWLCVPSIRASVEARPYALVLFSVAVAVAGFQWAVQSGNRTARVVWILGGAAVAWSHYVQYPAVIGLFVAYALLPDLRLRYTPKRFFVDGLWQFGLVALCTPQIFTLLARRGTLSWIDESNHLVFLQLLLPLVPAIVMGLTDPSHQRDANRVENALRRSLMVSIVFHVVTLEGAALAGMNLLSARYFLAILVPGLLLAAMALTQVCRAEMAAALLAFGIITGGTLILTKRETGTFSGNGYQNWKGAVDELSARVRSEQNPLILFRSGFVEEDVLPLGRPTSATLAPLRSPGRDRFGAPVRSLTFRWNRPARQEYFEHSIAPEVTEASRFLLLSSTGGTEKTGYTDQFVKWIEDTWPAKFQIDRDSFGGVELLEFRRKRP